MTKTEYLYGHPPSRYLDLKLMDAIKLRYEDAQILQKMLEDKLPPLDKHTPFALKKRLHKVKGAVLWCREFIDEVELG